MEAVLHVLVDDFVGCGSNQVLFISSPEKNSYLCSKDSDILSFLDEEEKLETRVDLSKFILTNWSGIHVNRWNQDSTASKVELKSTEVDYRMLYLSIIEL